MKPTSHFTLGMLVVFLIWLGYDAIAWRECVSHGGIYMREFGDLFYRCMQ